MGDINWDGLGIEGLIHHFCSLKYKDFDPSEHIRVAYRIVQALDPIIKYGSVFYDMNLIMPVSGVVPIINEDCQKQGGGAIFQETTTPGNNVYELGNRLVKLSLGWPGTKVLYFAEPYKDNVDTLADTSITYDKEDKSICAIAKHYVSVAKLDLGIARLNLALREGSPVYFWRRE